MYKYTDNRKVFKYPLVDLFDESRNLEGQVYEVAAGCWYWRVLDLGENLVAATCEDVNDGPYDSSDIALSEMLSWSDARLK